MDVTKASPDAATVLRGRCRRASVLTRSALTIAAIAGAPLAMAQSVCLPSPRLLTTTPMGGQVGTTVDVVIAGESIDGATELVFSDRRVTAAAKLDGQGKAIPHQFVVSIAADCPVGLHEARVVTSLGLSSSRVFSVGRLVEVVQTKPSASPEDALAIPVNSTCNAVMPVRAVNHYRFSAREDQRFAVDCAAGGIDSKLKAVIIVADAEGRDLVVERRGGVLDFTAPEAGEYVLKVHDLTFQGGPYYFYRLSLRDLPPDGVPEAGPATEAVNAFSWPPDGLAKDAETPEAEPNDDHRHVQSITLPCDVSGAFFPAADVDLFEFTARKGQTWWVEVGSERLGLPTDPSVLIQKVGEPSAGSEAAEALVDVAELSDIPSPVKVSGNGYAYDGPPYDAGSTDVLGKVEIPADGRYRLKILDLFGGTRNEIHNRYRLVIREARPDFALVAWALHMELRNGDRNALSKPISLRPGATMALEVVALRRDGFDGDIELSMEDLPEGVSAQGLTIPAGQARGMMLVTASDMAPPGWTNATLVGRALLAGETVTRPCRVASMAWPVKDAWSEIPSPRLLLDVPVSVGGAEIAPLTIASPDGGILEVEAGQSLTIPLALIRRGEFSGTTMSIKTMGRGFDANPKFDLSLEAGSAEVVLDLAKLKIDPGEYRIAFYGGAVAKYSPEAMARDPDKTKPSGRPSTQDIADIVVSEPIAIRVKTPERK